MALEKCTKYLPLGSLLQFPFLRNEVNESMQIMKYAAIMIDIFIFV